MRIRSKMAVILWILTLLGIAVPSRCFAQGIEYEVVEHSLMVTLSEEHRYPSYTGVLGTIWTGKVNPNNTWIYVNITVEQIGTTAPLRLTLWINYEYEGNFSEDGADWMTVANSSLNPHFHTLSVGDHFEYVHNDTFPSEVRHTLVIGVKTVQDIIFKGSITLNVSLKLWGWQEEIWQEPTPTTTSSTQLSTGVGFLVGSVIFLLSLRIARGLKGSAPPPPS